MSTSSGVFRRSNAVPSPEGSGSTILLWYGLFAAPGGPFPSATVPSSAVPDTESDRDCAFRARASLKLRLRPHLTPAFWHRKQSSPSTRSHYNRVISSLLSSEVTCAYPFPLSSTSQTSCFGTRKVGRRGGREREKRKRLER
jgi:hypothetical protein